MAPNRRVIHVTCKVHGGPRGFTNLVATKRDGLIELDPHVTGGCVIILDEDATTELFHTLRGVAGMSRPARWAISPCQRQEVVGQASAVSPHTLSPPPRRGSIWSNGGFGT
jgi:hypothetical protein